MAQKLGKLSKVDLRELWRGEASDFTPWLAQEENIKLLGEEIDIELEVQGQEERVGPFRADILCKDTVTDKFVLIENQLEKTDHNHLGQLLTYTAGLDVHTIIWIAKNFTEEHRAALDWLNRVTSDEINFFGIEIEAYRIGNSDPAPMFNIVAKPNDWSKTIRRAAISEDKLTERNLLLNEYWEGLKEYLETTKSFLKSQTPSFRNWTSYPMGSSQFHMSVYANMKKDKQIGISLRMKGANTKENFMKLKSKYFDELAKIFGNEIEWYETDSGKRGVVNLIYRIDPSIKEDWKNQYKWLKENTEKFYMFFSSKIKELKS